MLVYNEWNNSRYEVLLEIGKWDHFIEFLICVRLCFEMSIQFVNELQVVRNLSIVTLRLGGGVYSVIPQVFIGCPLGVGLVLGSWGI